MSNAIDVTTSHVGERGCRLGRTGSRGLLGSLVWTVPYGCT